MCVCVYIYIYIYIYTHTHYKTAVVQPPASYIRNHSNKTNWMCMVLQEEQGQNHKWCSLMASCPWTCQCWPISKDLVTSALYGHRMQPVWPPRSNGQNRWIARGSAKSALSAWLDDAIYIYIFKQVLLKTMEHYYF